MTRGEGGAQGEEGEVGLADDGGGGEAAAALGEVRHSCDEGQALELDAAHDEGVAEAVSGALGDDDDDHEEGQRRLRVAHLEEHDAEADRHAHLACMPCVMSGTRCRRQPRVPATHLLPLLWAVGAV